MENMGDDSTEREEGGRFKPSVTLADALEVFDQVSGPVVTSSDIAEQCDCTPQTAKRKLEKLESQGQVQSRETAGRTVWWRVDDDGELVTDGGGMDCTSCGERHAEWTKQGSGPAGPSSGGGHNAWRCDRCGSVEWVGTND